MPQCHFEVTIHIQYTITTLSNEQQLQPTTQLPCECFTLDSKQIIRQFKQRAVAQHADTVI